MTEQELIDVLNRPRIAEKADTAFLSSIRGMLASAERINVRARVFECRDPKDNKFLELAQDGSADVIVSGDLDLLVLGAFRGVPIMTPAMFGLAQNL